MLLLTAEPLFHPGPSSHPPQVVYSWAMFQRRSHRIRNTYAGHFGEARKEKRDTVSGGDNSPGLSLTDALWGIRCPCPDELYGPVAVCVLLFAAVLANFIIRLKHHDGKVKTPKSPWLAAYINMFVDTVPESAPYLPGMDPSGLPELTGQAW